MKVVVVEDQPRMLDLVTRYLGEKGIDSTGCLDGEQGLTAIGDTDPDVVVLDLMLPGLSGTAICKALRAAGDDVPIIMLTARGEVRERVAGLEAGADDYLVKPFALEELHARVRAVARRRAPGPSGVTAIGDIRIDFNARRVWVGSEEITLTRREFDVLAVLAEHPGRVVSRLRMHAEIWEGDEVELRSNPLEVHMSHLRGRLSGSAQVSITTLRGVGYRLDVRP